MAIALALIVVISGIMIWYFVPDNNIIANGYINRYDINGNIVIWTESIDNENYHFYKEIPNGKAVNFAGPNCGTICNVENNNIIWVDSRFIDESPWQYHEIHIYNISSETDSIIASNINGALNSYTPRISNNLIVWQSKYYDANDNWTADFYSYDLTTQTTEVLLPNIRAGELHGLEGKYMLYYHFFNNWSVLNIEDSSVYNLDIPLETRHWWPDYLIDEASLSNGHVLFRAYTRPSDLNHTDNMMRDDDRGYWLFNLHTQEYEMLIESKSMPDIDGNHIVWCGLRYDENSSMTYPTDIYLYNITNGSEIQLTDNVESEYHPKISGNYVVFREGDKFILLQIE